MSKVVSDVPRYPTARGRCPFDPPPELDRRLRIPTLRLAVPLDEIKFKQDMVVYGVHELPVTW
ncbi:hypothetical protein [Streptomyces iranensis]|uniref:Cytochrome P450 n=1 Tax=Streptomyces iranensis TaxID=576784 RepID=A0A061A022_9ACTN|nr:hypothetical protein [Streptomyces iranensis]MBP2066126.1 hypothetical protein [Streptomyces iranensis]CDR13285.1 cytochrome P450 [Streptomyces iranensis]